MELNKKELYLSPEVKTFEVKLSPEVKTFEVKIEGVICGSNGVPDGLDPFTPGGDPLDP